MEWWKNLRIPVQRTDGRIVYGHIEPVTTENLEDTLDQLKRETKNQDESEESGQ